MMKEWCCPPYCETTKLQFGGGCAATQSLSVATPSTRRPSDQVAETTDAALLTGRRNSTHLTTTEVATTKRGATMSLSETRAAVFPKSTASVKTRRQYTAVRSTPSGPT